MGNFIEMSLGASSTTVEKNCMGIFLYVVKNIARQEENKSDFIKISEEEALLSGKIRLIR